LKGVYEYTEPAEDGSQQLVINAQNWYVFMGNYIVLDRRGLLTSIDF
jgi:hypothetical protein